MTDLGRGYGSPPWNSGDPLQGDPPQGGIPGQRPPAQDGHGRQAPQGGYGPGEGRQQGGGQPSGWPGDPYGGQANQPQYPNPQQQPQYPNPQQPYPQQQPQYPNPQQPYPQQQPQYPNPQQPYPQQQPQYPNPQQPYPQQQPQYPNPQQQPQYPNPQQPYPQQQPQYPNPQQPYPQQQPHQPAAQPQAPGPRRSAGGPGGDGIDWQAEAAALNAPQADPAADEQPARQDEESAAGKSPEQLSGEPGDVHAEEAEDDSFFGPEDDSRGAERRRKTKGKKSGRRNSGACLVVALVLVGGVSAGGYYGYTLYQSHFGPPPDYTGSGTGSVQVEVKDGATVSDMALALQQAGVIKSAGAFLDADKANGSKAATIQPGFYTLQHQMAGSAALKEMLASVGGDALIIREGIRATEVYTEIDEKLKLDKGTTAQVAQKQRDHLGLPAYAKGNIEGFLFPTRYSIGKSTKPEDLLKQMVANAKEEYTKLAIDAGFKEAGVDSAYQVIIEASIVQEEGFDSNDFGKIARVIYNRLHWFQHPHKLEMDSTLNYARGVTTINNSKQDTQFKSPYNTYNNEGLPPGPIGNPGEDAIKAALQPEEGKWFYFTTVKGHETRFEETSAEHDKDVEEFNDNQSGGG